MRSLLICYLSSLLVVKGLYYFPLNNITPQESSEHYSVSWARAENFAGPSGVSISLDKMSGPVGQVRVPHWHSSTELHYLLEGTCRVSTLFNGYEETFVLKPGDVFATPEGYLHFFEKISEDDVVMVNLFSSGDVDTFDLTESFGLIRSLNPHILAKTFGVDLSLINSLHAHGPNEKKDNFASPLPDYKYEKSELTKKRRCFFIPDLDGNDHKQYGEYYPQTKIIWGTQPFFPQMEAISFAQIHLAPGALREPQWNGVGDEIIFVISGTVEVGIVGKTTQPAEKWVVSQYNLAWTPKNFVSYIYNNGTTPASVLLMYNTEAPELTSLRESYTKIPREVLSTIHRVPAQVFEKFKTLSRTPNPDTFSANAEGCPRDDTAKLRLVG